MVIALLDVVGVNSGEVVNIDWNIL